MNNLISFGTNKNFANNFKEQKIENIKLAGTYTDDCNLLYLNKVITAKLCNNSEELDQLRSAYNKELDKIKAKQTIIERKFSLNKIIELDNKIKELESATKYKSYIREVDDILNSYRKIGPLKKVISFNDNSNSNNKEINQDTQDTQETRRQELISKYIKITNKYIKLDIVKTDILGNKCRGCDGSLSGALINEDGITRCPFCYTEHINLIACVNDETDTTCPAPVSNGQGSNYEDRKTFIKTIMNFQGKQPNRLGDIEDRLDKYFTIIGFPIGSEIRKLPLNKDGTRGKTSRDLLFSTLKELGLSIYYEDDWLICHEYWGWNLHNIEHLEETLVVDYDLSQPFYEMFKGERKSNMNAQYRLFRHLERLGYDCFPDDFRIVKTPDILDFYERTWVKMCEGCGWNKPIPISAYPRRTNLTASNVTNDFVD